MNYYQDFKLSKLNTEKFSHVKLLFYWIIYGSFFYFVERATPNRDWNPMYCVLDDYIPFIEIFVIPYVFWFVYLIGMIVYTLLCDIPSFKRLMWFIIITYSITMFIYLVYPTSQELRPTEFERDNVFTRFLSWFYTFDTNTNVNPSIHVTGSLAVMFASWHTKRFSSLGWKIAFAAVGVLICMSTVLVKQHSIIDVITAVLLCIAVYPIVFGKKKVKQ